MYWIHVPLLKSSKLTTTTWLNPQYNSVLFSQTLDKHCALKLVKQMDIAEGERKTQSKNFM